MFLQDFAEDEFPPEHTLLTLIVIRSGHVVIELKGAMGDSNNPMVTGHSDWQNVELTHELTSNHKGVESETYIHGKILAAHLAHPASTVSSPSSTQPQRRSESRR